MSLLVVFKNTLFVVFVCLMACGSFQRRETPDPNSANKASDTTLVVAANRTSAYFPLLEGKNFALVANQTSVIFTADSGKDAWVHLADSLLGAGFALKKVFAPEHGFRGVVDAGEKIQDGRDYRTGLPVLSLYGKNRKPSSDQLTGLELVVFDIQDVGVRFYTYIATLQLVMEACAEAGLPVVVLDRPNPNAHYIDGPVMVKEHQSFLGMTEIPLVYGMTIGEYALMINEEGWLEGGKKAKLTVIPLDGYDRARPYDLPIPPSPNLPNTHAALLYPSLGLFEGTRINAGRGTSLQFQSFGAPFLLEDHFDFSYRPESRKGATNPKHKGETCHGRDLSAINPPNMVNLEWLIESYTFRQEGSEFFISGGFTRHAGTTELQKQIESGMDAASIRSSWQEKLEAFDKIRSEYLIYD